MQGDSFILFFPAKEKNPPDFYGSWHPQTFNTTYSKSDLKNTVRIIRPHHPLFGQTVNIVKIWEHKKKRYYVIELPDKSHTRIPLHWADNDKTPLTEPPRSKQLFTVQAIREITGTFIKISQTARTILHALSGNSS